MGLEDKSLVYLNQEMSPEYSERSGTRLPSEVRILRGYKHKVLTDDDLVKYQKGRAAYAANRELTHYLCPALNMARYTWQGRTEVIRCTRAHSK